MDHTRTALFRIYAIVVLCGGSLPVHGQMVSASMGRLHEVERSDFTYTWKLDYRQQIAPGWAVSLGWLNEGHIPDHHRDGSVLQVWKYWQPGDFKGRVAAGVGIYRAYDTITTADGYLNEHGTRGIFTLAYWHPLDSSGKWLAMLEVNRTNGGWDPQTQSISVGIGRRLGAAFGADVDGSEPQDVDQMKLNDSINLYYGTTILNSFSSQKSEAYQVEYRRNLSPYWEWSLGYSNEGSPEVIRREGLVAQAWVGGWFLDQKFQASFGVGPFAHHLTEADPTGTDWVSSNHISVRVTLGLAWRVTPASVVRLAWNRTATSYHRDSDVIVGGIGVGW